MVVRSRLGGARFAQSVCLAIVRGDPHELPPGWAKYADNIGRVPALGHAAVAAALMMVGRLEEARVLYEPLARRIPAMKRGLMVDASIFYLVALAPRLNDAAGCAAVKGLLTTRFGKSPVAGAGTVFYAGSIARMAAEADLGRGECAAAVAGFEEGLRAGAALGARPYLARGRLALARALSATGDLAQAASNARAAAADARRLDMPGLLAEADAFLAGAAAEARAQDPLTAREREVAELVAQALPNREVARALVLSERTVESHVRTSSPRPGSNQGPKSPAGGCGRSCRDGGAPPPPGGREPWPVNAARKARPRCRVALRDYSGDDVQAESEANDGAAL